MDSGTYRVYRTRLDAQGVPHHQLCARFIVNNGFIHYLEDDDNVSRILEPGEVNAKKEQRLRSMAASGYLKVVHEDDLNAGCHPEHLQVMDLGETCPEATFDLVSNGKKQLLEVYGGATVLDGRTLSDDETRILMAEVAAKKKLLEPRG